MGQDSRASVDTKEPFDVLEASFLGAYAPGGSIATIPITGSEVAFAGRSNVGKSSLINALVRRKGLVRTSATPGCTRQLNFFSVRARDGFQGVFVDLPGYGFAKRSKAERADWADLIEGYLGSRANLRMLVLVVDLRRGLEEDDLALLKFATEHRDRGLAALRLVVVATKADKVTASRIAPSVAALSRQARQPVVGFSAETKRGYGEVWTAIRRA